MRIGDTQISPRQGAFILMGIAFSFLSVIIHLKIKRIPVRESGKITAVLAPPKIEITKNFSLDELIQKAASSDSGGAGEEVISFDPADEESVKATPAGKINLNTAGEDELMGLPDITRRAAKSIIEYREKMGEIWELSEISGLPGIDDTLINRMRRQAVLE
ncbi:MAG: helix-hairpin-helix domain-containing protein [Elusimicrobiota bacterium]|nr:helix-hairpin-helix domain-containing protein [Elusimicrobiota bacterium]